MADFLLEIGLDEVPARMIAGAEAELGERVTDLLTRERLLGANGKVTTYSTPRRLAVLVEDVLASQAATEEQLIGPSWKVAFKDGQSTAAAQAFAKKAGLDATALARVLVTGDPKSLSNREAVQTDGFTALEYLIDIQEPISGLTAGASQRNIFSCSGNLITAKGEYYAANISRPGRTTTEILAAELPKEVLGLYWAKNMYWRAGKPERFVRPIRWVVALLDADVVPVEIAGIRAGKTSRGHRVLHGAEPVIIGAPKDYAEKLRAAKVVVDVAERRHIIRKALDAATRTVPGARWREDEALIETVVHLTEWPSVILGGFEAEYLALPEEVLVTVMRDHQKYFAVESADGKLAPHFLAVLNIEVDAEGRANIVRGNERVLRARFKDARFFWDFDQRIRLEDRFESLKNVTFKKELGSYFDKTERNLKVVEVLSDTVKLAGVQFDGVALKRAVRLAKADLTTELVKEFTELQGVIGGLYARAQELGESVASAIYYQFKPAFTGDVIPPTVEGQLLGLADRIETITAMFDKGFQPTGSKDPFALRRAASAIVKILAESNLPLTLRDILHAPGTESEQGIGPDDKFQPDSPVRAFLKERQRFDLQEVRGFPYDVVNAVLATGADDVPDAIELAKALTRARLSENFIAVCMAFKRMRNILRQAEENGQQIGSKSFQGAVLKEPEEVRLYKLSEIVAARVDIFRQQRNYSEALEAVAALRPVVDAFFEKVLVMVPDEKLRAARLGLIQFVLDGFSSIADFSEIVAGGV